jgi:hypothetical protein
MGENFFQRWARRKSETVALEREKEPQGAKQSEKKNAPVHAALASTPAHPGADPATPASDTIDVAYLAAGADKAVRRAALKQLLSDPHFQQMDGLDVYIGDYTRPDPLTAAMRAGLAHARGLLDDPEQCHSRAPGCLAQVDEQPEQQASVPARALPATFDASPVAREEAGFDRHSIPPPT